APRIDIPAGDLAAALDAYARQSGTQLVYRADQLKGARSTGVQGQPASPQTLDALLKGSGYRAQRDASGAVVIPPPRRRAPRRPRRHRPLPPPMSRSPTSAPCRSPVRAFRARRWKARHRSP
ncbi:MAG: STN domain-containing protein, partial [Thermomonas sp.]